jgi:hypothetical protein
VRWEEREHQASFLDEDVRLTPYASHLARAFRSPSIPTFSYWRYGGSPHIWTRPVLQG